MTRFVFEANSVAETSRLGHCLGKGLFPGAVAGLVGPLGAGKTQLVRAVAEGLEVRNSKIVTSPTFVLIQEYDARLPIYHFDAYRLRTAREFLELGVEEYFEGEGVCLVEWADRVAGCLPKEMLHVDITSTGSESRRFELRPVGGAYEGLVEGVKVELGGG